MSLAATDYSMVTRFGISFIDENARDRMLLEKIHAPMEYGDQRAPRIRNLIGMGLAAEDALNGLEFDSPEEREAFIQRAVRREVKRTQSDSEPQSVETES